MRVLIADKFPTAGQDALRGLGLEVDFQPALDAESLPGALAESGAAILIVRSTKVSAAAIEAGANLSLIVRAGAGVNTIDCAAASRRGVFVANCPGKNAIAVAELAMGLLIAADRGIAAASAEFHGGRWNKKAYGNGRGLQGRVLGIVGFGAIAQAMAQRALGFGMRVVAYSRSLTDAEAEAAGVERAASLGALLPLVDALSVHVPLNDATRHLIGQAELAALRDGAIVIHTARGGVVDDEALRAELDAGRLRAGLDVYENEPAGGVADCELPLRGCGNLVATPHVGASTEQAQEAIADETIRIVQQFLTTGNVPNTVNVAPPSEGVSTVVVRHADRVGVLAGVLQTLRKADLNVQQMHNVIFSDDGAACASIRVKGRPSAELLAELRERDHVLAVDLRG